MTNFFNKTRVDLRSRKAMVSFLFDHPRYSTQNSWNRSTSYSNCIKVHRLGLSREQLDKAFDLMSTDENYWDLINDPIHEFTAAMGGAYTIGTNGRSGGYLVLYNSRYEPTGYKSFCRCGQRNYKRVAQIPEEGTADHSIFIAMSASGGTWWDQQYLSEPAIAALDLSEADKVAVIRRMREELRDATLDNKCGRCGASGTRGRINYAKTPMQLSTSMHDIDQGETFEPEDWSMGMLRDRVRLVQAFDAACDEIRENFLDLIDNADVVEETILVPTTVRRIEYQIEA